jgi:Calcineurin-like phosphoesterase
VVDLLNQGRFHELFGEVVDHLDRIVAGKPETKRGEKTSPSVHKQLLEAAKAAQQAEGDDTGKGTYYSRHPVVSLAQSAFQQRREAKPDEEMGDPFTKADLGWVVEIGLSLFWRLLHDRHPFCDEPATGELQDSARLVLVSDWGTGREEAEEVAAAMRAWIEKADRPVHVVHLGDTYYSGMDQEVRDHILDLWPVKQEEKDSTASWCLNGNHDMYSGGRGYFDTLLGDPRFWRQRAANGAPTSWLSLQSKRWNLVGLDTAWNDHLPFEWRLGHLYGGQAEHVAKRAADSDRKLMLLSHHQLFTVDDDDRVGEHIREELGPTLEEHGVDVWFWGHEHDCLAYHPHQGVEAAYAIGHGAVPELAAQPPAEEQPFVKWRFDEHTENDDGEKWAKHGFAVVDLSPENATVHHIREDGTTHTTEELPA